MDDREEIRVLHVDDDPEVAAVATTFLRRHDDRFVTETATSAAAGIAALSGQEFDCLVADYDMPGRDGIELLETVRARFGDLPVILFTGEGSESVASEAIAAGVTDYLPKSGDPDQYAELADRIATAVGADRTGSSRARQRRSADGGSEQVSAVGGRGPALLANETLVEDRETAAEELVGSRIDDVLDPATADRARGTLGEFRQGVSGPASPGDGAAAYTIDGVFSPVTDEDGDVPLVVTDRSVAERPSHERELAETNAVLSTLVDALPVGVIAEDASRTVLAVNDRFFELFDLSGGPGDVVGADCEQLAETVGDMFADPAGFVRGIDERIAGGTPTDDELLALADGRTFERSYRPIALPGGDGHLWLYRDVTDRVDREGELKTTVEFLERLYDVATDRTVDVEQKITRLLELGSEQLSLPPGYLTRIEVIDEGRETGTQRVIEASGDHELLQPGSACPLPNSYCRKTIKADGVVAIEDALAAGWGDDPAYELFELGCYIGTALTVDDELYGTVFFGEQEPRTAPFTEAERTFVRLMSQLVSYELEREQARQALEQQNERLEEFAGIVSHDLRNPLNVAAGRLALGREEADNEHFEQVARAHERMDVLIDELLTLAREGEAAIDPEPVDLADCVEACWRTVDTGDASLVVDTDRSIDADRSQLQQLLENLFRNSVEHGGPAVTVRVGDTETGFYVEDDGPGIPEDARKEVFAPGYSTSDAGTGFGLRIAEQVVAAHGWTIALTESEAGGARFEISGVLE